MGNLNLDQIASAQQQKHTTSNDADDQLDKAMTELQAYTVDESNAVVVTVAEQRRAAMFHLQEASPSPTGGISMTFPATRRGIIVIINDTSQTVTVEIEGSPTQSVTPPTVSANTTKVLVHDGANIRGLA